MGLIVYCILGPVLWTLFALSTHMAHFRMNRLKRPAPPLPPLPPRVTILIPAKDEGDAVRECLDRVLALDYPDFHIVAIDDRSGDNTGAIFDEYASKYSGKLTALHIKELPAGWQGKCNALATAEAKVDSEWILFVDSDVKVEPDSLKATLTLALERKYDAVTIMTALECHTFWERLILPLCAAAVGSMTLISYTNDDNRKTLGFANGQFFLIRRAAYEAVGGHGAVRDNITEDVALVRLLKSKNFRARIYFGRDFASTRMHGTLKQMFNGWARIFSGVSNRRPWAILAAAAFTMTGLAVYPALAYALSNVTDRHHQLWLAASATHLLIMTAILAVVYRFSRNERRSALLFPLAGPMLLAIFVYALRRLLTGRIALGDGDSAIRTLKPRAAMKGPRLSRGLLVRAIRAAVAGPSQDSCRSSRGFLSASRRRTFPGMLWRFRRRLRFPSPRWRR